ncbi:hypothetical protein D9611_010807 [Ephemerocybe angulata]|uniref:Uncharacterized protein n=1 Tax=Ephemerocybe angulata TaxID=980116 RepID=A0A8H5BCU1_9AGAR|nr:hypothetical protein D9611_010807 [Tulosesus angulatus]
MASSPGTPCDHDTTSHLSSPSAGPFEAPQGLPEADKSTSSPSAVEQVMVNQDLLYHIFSKFLPVDGESQIPGPLEREMLLQLAHTCQAFSIPALDCLWRCLSSLIPLIRLIPEVHVFDGAYYMVAGQPVGSSFTRYAKRVRFLEQSATDGASPTVADPSLYVLLAQALGNTSLLPGLVSLNISRFPSSSLPLHSLPLLFPPSSFWSLCSSSLKEATIADQALSPCTLRLILPLLFARTKLTYLSLNHHDAETFGDELWEDVVDFRGLEDLRIVLPKCRLPSFFLSRASSRLVDLRSLCLDVEWKQKKRGKVPSDESTTDSGPSVGTLITETSSSLVPKRFPNLRFLAFSSRSIGNPFRHRNILSSLFANLISLELSIPIASLSSLAGDEGLLKSCPSLKRMMIKEQTYSSRPREDEMAIPVKTLISFLLHPTLGQLIVEFARFGQAIDEGDSIEDTLDHILLTAKEPLRSLTLPRSWGFECDAPVQLLAKISQQAPGLERLAISIDSTAASTLVLNQKIPRFSSLRQLEIRDSRDIQDKPFTPREYKALACYLDDCFPQLTTVRLVSTDEPSKCEAWEFIESLRVLYQENRRLRARF